MQYKECDEFRIIVYKETMPKKDIDGYIIFTEPIEGLYKDFHGSYSISIESINLNELAFSGFKCNNFKMTNISIEKLENVCIIEAIRELYPEYFL